MASSFSCSRMKDYLSKENNSPLGILLTCSYCLGVVFFCCGLLELYKSKTFYTCQCKVKSIDLKFLNRQLFPRWNITIVYQHETINDSLILSNGFDSEERAWNQAHKYKINETYPCYRSRTPFSDWNWHWDKPSKLKVYSYLVGGVSLITIATLLLILRRCYRTQLTNRRRQEQLEISLNTEMQQQAATPVETPPPSYDEVVQSS